VNLLKASWRAPDLVLHRQWRNTDQELESEPEKTGSASMRGKQANTITEGARSIKRKTYFSTFALNFISALKALYSEVQN